jgi:hypothetical protein
MQRTRTREGEQYSRLGAPKGVRIPEQNGI